MAVKKDFELAIMWSDSLTDYGISYICVEMTEGEVDVVFDNCMTALDSGVFDKDAKILRNHIEWLAETLVDDYFNPRFVKLRKEYAQEIQS